MRYGGPGVFTDEVVFTVDGVESAETPETPAVETPVVETPVAETPTPEAASPPAEEKTD